MSLVSIANAADTAVPVMSTGSSLMSLFPMILIFVIFYFFLIRPQVKKQRALENMINELKKGDQVVAAGGLFGAISKIEDNFIYLEIADNLKVKTLKSSVSEVVSKTAKADEKAEVKKVEAKVEAEDKAEKVSKPVVKKAAPKKKASK